MKSHDYIDPIAVERALAGDLHGTRLTIAERREVVRQLNARGYCDRQIAERAECTPKTVLRIRQELGIRAVPEHVRAAGRTA